MTQTHGRHEVHLRDYLYILRKRRVVSILCFLIVVATSIFLTYKETVIYQAEATILIERENPNVVDFKEVMAFDASSTDYYQTQYQMLESRSLIVSLIEREDLMHDPYFRALGEGRLRRLLRERQSNLPDWLGQFLTKRSITETFEKSMLRIDPIRNTRLVRVSVLHPDPARSAKLTNSLVQLFIQKNLESRFLISSQAVRLLSEQLGELKHAVGIAEDELQNYKEENKLIRIPSLREKDEFIQEAKLELVKIQAEEAKLTRRYLDAHPKLIHIRWQIEALQGKIQEEEAKKLAFSRISVDYAQLEREADSARQTYETLLSRFQQMQSEAKTQASNVLIVDLAHPPLRPSKPRPFLNFIIACFVGFISGLILAFFSEYLDSTVKIPDDIEKGLGLELFGIIPHSPRDKKAPAGGEIFFQSGKPSQAAESFRALRTALLFRLRHVAGCRTLLVTSPNPGEGKSTVSLNLAVAFQQNHLKVLLVDADLRKPKLHTRLGIEAKPGLTEVLEHEASWPDVVRRDIAKDVDFDFMSCGTTSHRPTEVLGSAAMKEFLASAREVYDIIIIDSPPYLAVADVAVICEYADALVIVSRYHRTEKRHLRDIPRRFSMITDDKIGVVINSVSVREKDYYYHQYYYYGYGDSQAKK